MDNGGMSGLALLLIGSLVIAQVTAGSALSRLGFFK